MANVGWSSSSGGRRDPSIGERVGRFLLLQEAGRGRMGIVFKAVDRELSRFVAVKTPRSDDDRDREELVLLYRREARMLDRVRHPGAPRVLEFGEHRGLPYYAMEFVQGETLESVMGSLSLRKFIGSLKDVASVLHEAHESGVVHRDVKPANILVTGKRAMLVDWGLAKPLGETRAGSPGETADRERRFGGMSGSTDVEGVAGTPLYVSPEHLGVGRLGPASDLFSLGVILYRYLTGRFPFRFDSLRSLWRNVLLSDPVPPSRYPGVGAAGAPGGVRPMPEALDAVCLKLLEKKPEHRYASAAELVEELDRFLCGLPVRARLPGIGERLRRFLGRHAGVAATALVDALLFLVLAMR
ncbi:MAG: serine/threonine protein kinase [Planctomycetes bacterium]|nr:serine/threonine protein kinase [Planctomycetota bacterium]